MHTLSALAAKALCGEWECIAWWSGNASYDFGDNLYRLLLNYGHHFGL